MIREDTIEIHGFTFTITLEADEGYHDLSWLGKYSDTPETDAVDRNLNNTMGRGEYRYFNPANTIESHRKELCKDGYSKHQAHEIAKSYVLRDYRYSESLNNGNTGFSALIVDVAFKGRKLGTAAVGEIDDFETGKAGYLNELMIECIEQAIKYLTDLDSKPRTLGKAQTVLAELKAKASAEYKENRRASFLWAIKRWRNLSQDYQNNRTVTRHAWRHIQSKKIAYYRVR